MSKGLCISVSSWSPGLLVACWNHPGEWFLNFIPEMQLRRFFLFIWIWNISQMLICKLVAPFWKPRMPLGGRPWLEKASREGLWRLCCPLLWFSFLDTFVGHRMHTVSPMLPLLWTPCAFSARLDCNLLSLGTKTLFSYAVSGMYSGHGDEKVTNTCGNWVQLRLLAFPKLPRLSRWKTALPWRAWGCWLIMRFMRTGTWGSKDWKSSNYNCDFQGFTSAKSILRSGGHKCPMLH